MNIHDLRLKKRLQSVLSPSSIPALFALGVVVAAGVFADHQNQMVYQQGLRATAAHRLDLIRAKLEGNINGDILLVRGLISTIATEPNMGPQRFETLAKSLFKQKSQIKEVAGAPNLVVSLVYPVKGNEKAIGLDYRTSDAQRESVLRARDEGTLVFAGPVKLVQGGEAFIARFPVYYNSADLRRFWGVVSAVIDVKQLYQSSGVLDPDLNIDLAISNLDGLDKPPVRFYGDRAVLDNHPVTARIDLPGVAWQLAAVPKAGWNKSPPDAWWMRAVFVLAGLLILAPMVFLGRMLGERQRHNKEMKLREGQLERLSRRLSLALDTSRVGVWEMEIVANRLVWDDRMNELYGQPRDGAPRNYSHWHGALHPADRDRAVAEYQKALDTKSTYQSNYRVVTPSGEMRNIRAIGRYYEDGEGVARILGVNWDVSADVALTEDLKRAKSLTEARNAELEAAKGRIEHNSLHDSLTDLPNRRYLDDVLTRHATLCAMSGGSAALLHIDLDRFKQINDTLGHAAGDAMLVHASNILKYCVRKSDFVARIGGDEFVVVCLSQGCNDDLARLADRIIEDMRRPVFYEGHECRFGVSVGIATEAGPVVDPQRLMINADIALYRAKSRGRNRHEFFTDVLQAEIVRNKQIADDILSGLERAEFTAYYQPQFNARTLDIVGVEALVRWHHPGAGMLAPNAFLAIAEELNVVATIDAMILDQTLAHLADWRAAGLAIPRASVNVSSRRLHDENLINGLRKLDIPPATISFELVESIYLDESDEIVSWNIDQIKDLGIDIEIDDFGTGYASIVSLLKLSPRRLKIDRQLVIPITGSRGQRQLVSSIVDIGKSLGVEIIAEGVETMEHARLLADLGCDVLQGYALARPMSASEIEAFVRADAWGRVAGNPKKASA